MNSKLAKPRSQVSGEGRIVLVPLNPDYDAIHIAPHEGPEIVVVGEWLASI
jgi:hypothetical protein